MMINLVTDDEYLEVLLNLLDQAQKDIEVLAFSFAIGAMSGKINVKSAPYKVAEKLVELKRAKQSLNIRVYMEGVRSTSGRNLITAQFLEQGGIIVEYGATHAKGFCVDRRLVLFGSTNLTNQSMVKNYEANLLIDNEKIASEFHWYFEHLWEGGGHGGVTLRLPMLADGAFEAVLLEMIRSAKKSIEFSIYFFDLKSVRDALIEAHERGVHIKGFGLYHPSFALGYVYRTRRTIDSLKKAGIEDLYFKSGNNFAHAKYIIKDGKEILLGTGNWLKEDVEIHPQLHIHLLDAKLSNRLSGHLDSEISRSFSVRSPSVESPRL